MVPSLTDTFQALADPTRRSILRLLGAEPLTAGAIAEHFAISKPSISHHLHMLKQAEMVFDQRHGQHIVYTLNRKAFTGVMAWISDITR